MLACLSQQIFQNEKPQNMWAVQGISFDNYSCDILFVEIPCSDITSWGRDEFLRHPDLFPVFSTRSLCYLWHRCVNNLCQQRYCVRMLPITFSWLKLSQSDLGSFLMHCLTPLHFFKDSGNGWEMFVSGCPGND